MKVIVGKGHANEEGQRWFAVVPDDATSSQDPRRTHVLAPECLDQDQQGMWIEGYANAVKRFAAFDDLLAACKAIRNDGALTEIWTRPISPDNLPACVELIRAYLKRLTEKAEAAIAKAEGGTNAPTPS
jgi:hypothetical protein